MKIVMQGVDFSNTCLDIRQTVVVDKRHLQQMCQKIKAQTSAEGVAVVSTCNRTEVYACIKSDDIPNMIGIINPDFEGKITSRCGDRAVKWLFEVACGIHSQLRGDGQIMSQLTFAIAESRKCGCSCAELNTIFRLAVTAGKKAVCENIIKPIPESAAFGGIELIKEIYGSNLKGKKAVVIGNGKMGRLAQRLLIKLGCSVTVTLREYKVTHSNAHNTVEDGCNTVLYSKRYNEIDGADFVISATASPHFTITYDELSKLNSKPYIMLDLAIPRDIEPKCALITKCCCLDDLHINNALNEKQQQAICDITDEFCKKFHQWYDYRESLPLIEEIKALLAKRSAEKTVDMLLGGLKAVLTPQTLRACTQKIRERAK